MNSVRGESDNKVLILLVVFFLGEGVRRRRSSLRMRGEGGVEGGEREGGGGVDV